MIKCLNNLPSQFLIFSYDLIYLSTQTIAVHRCCLIFMGLIQFEVASLSGYRPDVKLPSVLQLLQGFYFTSLDFIVTMPYKLYFKSS